MSSQRTHLAQKAQKKAAYIRTEANLDPRHPICVFDLCYNLGLAVRFVDINMEGIYLKETKPKILISSLRPLVRRRFTCAHELGHHTFGHASKVDELIEEAETETIFQPDEFLANSFAGFLLMPALGIRKAFTTRNWTINSCTSEQLYTIACYFGVGYQTLVTHMAYSLKMLHIKAAQKFLKIPVNKIRQEILGYSTSEPLIISDLQWLSSTIDAEVGYKLVLPHGTKVDNNKIIEFEREHPKGHVFRAKEPGITRVYCQTFQWTKFVRVSRLQFTGLSQYRHLENPENE